MSVQALDARPGVLYRPTRLSAVTRRVWFTFPARPAKVISKLNPKEAHTQHLLTQLQRGYVLVRSWRRGILLSGHRYQSARWTTMSPQTKLRTIKRRPGYR